MLRKIIYPTGGYSVFEFENHKYSIYMSKTGINQISPIYIGTSLFTGGLRIKQITNYPDPNSTKAEITSYKYTNNYFSENSSGILGMRPNYFGNINGDVWNGYLSNPTFRNVSAISLSNYSGSHIMYSTIYEQKTIDDNTFYTEYNFTDHTMFPDIPYFSSVNPGFSSLVNCQLTDRSFLRGKLLSKNEFDKGYNLKRSALYLYRNDFSNIESQTVKGFQFMTLSHNLYKIYYADYYVVKEILREYNNGNSIKTEINHNTSDYPYNNVSSPIYNGFRRNYGSTQVNSLGETLTNIINYQFDCPIGTNCYLKPFGLIKSSTNFNGTNQISKEELTYTTINNNPSGYAVNEINSYKE